MHDQAVDRHDAVACLAVLLVVPVLLAMLSTRVTMAPALAAGNAVVLYGVSDLVVVTHDGLTLVTTMDRATDLKTLIASLPTAFRDRE